MPNVVRSRISVDSRWKDVLAVIKGEDSEFSFEKILPVPKELTEEDSYKWRIKNWETGYEPYATMIDFPYIYVETAWYPPLGVVRKLSTLFPDVTFTLDWTTADPIAPDFEGEQYTIKNGKESIPLLLSMWSINCQNIFQDLWGRMTEKEKNELPKKE